MREVVLPQQVLAVVISIRSAHNAMNVLLSRLRWVSGKLPKVCGLLVIKFDQDHRTVHAVIKRAIRLRAPDPRGVPAARSGISTLITPSSS